jgi:hypothetical protein
MSIAEKAKAVNSARHGTKRSSISLLRRGLASSHNTVPEGEVTVAFTPLMDLSALVVGMSTRLHG